MVISLQGLFFFEPNKDVASYEELKNGLDVEKIIFYLPDGSSLCTSSFLAHLIQIGIYSYQGNYNPLITY